MSTLVQILTAEEKQTPAIAVRTVHDTQWNSNRYQVKVDGSVTLLTAGTSQRDKETLREHVNALVELMLTK